MGQLVEEVNVLLIVLLMPEFERLNYFVIEELVDIVFALDLHEYFDFFTKFGVLGVDLGEESANCADGEGVEKDPNKHDEASE